eukprot:gb/GEZN01010134.1/.p1 GENE.gb/GEZN01010134.1/~~gb/GEZN01010134.1/.p1  ORF type:complete len:277 (+),score=25.53 gb/GEZN01010134.1/:233-1063(+)
MRFRAFLVEHKNFNELVQTLEKLSANCIINFTDKQVKFHLPSEFTSGEQAFAEIPATSMFDHYRIENKKTRDQIPVCISLTNLARALTSGECADKILIKLTKKNNRAFLTFEMQSGTMLITQDVPVQLQPMHRLQECEEPSLPDPPIKFLMPPLKSLATVVERISKLSTECTLICSSDKMTIQVEADMVTVRTFYTGLTLSRSTGMESNGPLQGESAPTMNAKISLKKFANILHCRALGSNFTIGCIIQSQAFVVVLKLRQNQGLLTYYVPLIAED